MSGGGDEQREDGSGGQVEARMGVPQSLELDQKINWGPFDVLQEEEEHQPLRAADPYRSWYFQLLPTQDR